MGETEKRRMGEAAKRSINIGANLFAHWPVKSGPTLESDSGRRNEVAHSASLCHVASQRDLHFFRSPILPISGSPRLRFSVSLSFFSLNLHSTKEAVYLPKTQSTRYTVRRHLRCIQFSPADSSVVRHTIILSCACHQHA
jgi:hypothetical protein